MDSLMNLIVSTGSDKLYLISRKRYFVRRLPIVWREYWDCRTGWYSYEPGFECWRGMVRVWTPIGRVR